MSNATNTQTVVLAAAGSALVTAAACYLLLRYRPITYQSSALSRAGNSQQQDPKTTPTLSAPTAFGLHASHDPVGSTCSSSTSQQGLKDYEQDEIVAEQLTRNTQFFGAEGQRKVCGAFVIVVGLGGVGSHAAHLLLRSGVGRLRLIDFDQVTLSSLNRHAVATRADVGIPKATCLAQHFARIMPEAAVEAKVAMYTSAMEDELLGGQPDWVLDAIDNVDTKVDLVAACKRRGLRVLSCAGAGAKADPTRLHIVDVSESVNDPLARALRLRLRRDHNIAGGVPVLLSTEKPRCKLVSVTGADSAAQLAELQVVPNFRVRSIPVLGTTPAVFGMAAAAHILCELAEAPFDSEPVMLASGPQYTRQMDRLLDKEATLYGSTEGVQVDLQDVVYLVRELWRGFSARSDRILPIGGNIGLQRSTADLVLTRWDPSQPAALDNLVLLTVEEAEAHEVAVGSGRGVAGVRVAEPQWAAKVEATLARARRDHGY